MKRFIAIAVALSSLFTHADVQIDPKDPSVSGGGYTLSLTSFTTLANSIALVAASPGNTATIASLPEPIVDSDRVKAAGGWNAYWATQALPSIQAQVDTYVNTIVLPAIATQNQLPTGDDPIQIKNWIQNNVTFKLVTDSTGKPRVLVQTKPQQ